VPTLGVVLFDFGGTLDADGARWSARFHRLYQEGGGALGLTEFDQAFRESDRRLARRTGIGALGFAAMVRLQSKILAELFCRERELAWGRIAERFIGDSTRVTTRNQTLLKRLTTRYRLGVVSNFSGNLVPCLEELRLGQYFEVVIDSAVLGAEKPDPEPFRAALSALRAPPDQSWMVGDNPEADIRPALELGLSACWVTEPSRVSPPGLIPTARIASLLDLDTTLDRVCTG
jgi:HAD superfamily hydrolase (TIGR01549 family)